MLITCWSVKGGSGVSVVTAALGGLMAQRHGAAAIIDFGGDQPAALGLAEPAGPGVLDWCDSAAEPEALGRLGLEVAEDLILVPRGQGPELIQRDRAGRLVEAATALSDVVVVDAGIPLTTSPPHAALDGPPDDGTVLRRRRYPGEFLREAGTSLFVTRACYLSLRRAMRVGIDADGVVLLEEPGRTLRRRDVSELLGLPVIGVVEADPAVARAVDAGTLVRRVPHALAHGLRRAG